MRWPVPRTIAGRTVLVLVVGLTLSHLVSMAVHYTEGADAYAILEARRMAERMATITRLVEEAAPGDRARILGAVSDPAMHAAWGRDSEITGGAGAGGYLTEHMLRSHLGPRRPGRVRIAYGEEATPGPAMMREHMRTMRMGPAMPGHMRASVELADSSWLNFAVPVEAPAQLLSLRVVLSLSVMVLAVIALSVWAVRRMTAPLATFARAAERLGMDVTSPRLPETGPREVRQATRAFNEMQRRIRRFVEDRTQLVAAIAHDLRTPITRLRLHAEFVEDEDQRHKMLADLEEMEGMIASTLGFARDDAASEPRETVDLVTLLQSVCDDMADAGQPVEFEAEGRLTYECRRIALRRAFANLIENAVKYGQRARVSVDAGEDLLVVRVDDDGPGIPAQSIDEVFKPFRRLEGSRGRDTGGTGLGLTVARTIVRAHGGDIALSNRAEGGLRVEVTLPR
jgi:signal transduction histidine kinase